MSQDLSITAKKKKPKKVRPYVEFRSPSMVPPFLALFAVVVAEAILGFLSLQVWQSPILAIKIVVFFLWAVVTFLGITLWLSLYHRRIRLYDEKLVIYGFVLRRTFPFRSIAGYIYRDARTVMIYHRNGKKKAKVYLEVHGRANFEEWLKKGFANLG